MSARTCNTSSPRLYGCMPSASLAGSIMLMIAFSSTPLGSGSCTINPVQAGSSLSSRTASAIWPKLASAGSSFLTEVIPTSWQSACLPATYFIEPGSSPTSSVPSPGTTPCALSLFTRSARSALIVAATLLAVDYRGHPYPSILFGAFYRNDRLSLEQIRIISFVHLNEEGTPWGFGLHDSRNSPQPA